MTTDRHLALVRPPSPRLADGIVTHIERTPVDVHLARRQWQHYVDALAANGWTPIEVDPADDCPDGVFIEDAVVMFRGIAIVTRPGSPLREPETTTAEAAVRGLGFAIHYITPPGTLDGGDVLKVGDVIYIGRGGRTNDEGIRQFASIVEPLGAQVITVPLTKVLHLKSAVTALPDGTIIGWEPGVDDPGIFPNFTAMPEESGAHVVILDENTLLMAADAPQSAAWLRSLGYRTVEVDISEYIKLEGCVTCLSVRVR